MPNKPWIKASALLSAEEKINEQRKQESNEHEKEYRKLCNVVMKAAKTDKEDSKPQNVLQLSNDH